MIQVFSTMADYVNFMSGLPFLPGESLSTSYIPSAFFPKDSIAYYFEHREVTSEAHEIVEKLWQHGKALLKALQVGKASLCIEGSALDALCSAGRVHEATPGFEVAFAARVHVLERLWKVYERGRLAFSQTPTPFVFRLHPPAGVLIDVTHNIPCQLVQGLWINETSVFQAFALEFERLKATSSPRLIGDAFEKAIVSLRSGNPCRWPPI